METKSISIRMKDFWDKQCEEPIVGARIKEAWDTVKGVMDERKNGKTSDSGDDQSSSSSG